MENHMCSPEFLESPQRIRDAKGNGSRIEVLQHQWQRPQNIQNSDEDIEVAEAIEITPPQSRTIKEKFNEKISPNIFKGYRGIHYLLTN